MEEEISSSPSSACPNTVTVRRNPPRRARPTPASKAPAAASTKQQKETVSAFPMDDILSIDVDQNIASEVCSSSSSAAQKPAAAAAAESLRVYLRVRPLPAARNDGNADLNPRSRSKNAWPQNPSKKAPGKAKVKKEVEECITVKDSQSITLCPPLALQDSKRMKLEVYEGFSHVFSGNSPQEEVYEKMVSPLVEDFLRGKSGMIAALGPSGSGKTHTIFGCPRDPGMVPLALQRIFKISDSSGSESSRSFYLSMFEICSERGKGERLIDLSPDGSELCMQQSTLKGLQEAIISDFAQAESLIARGMFKRATAMTNSNSQSSRSQCIINIRSASSSSDAVLTIVDLAGAEREKRTGNQGARLVESNFINNTSMVFGLCLRSLLEHQKNPKKLLQKHFQNSLLTRYLRDYLEGKKRMTLILTVKSGEEDYLDASYLLRQASPFMKIKFTNIEEQPNLLSNKRDLQTLPGVKQPKRMKLGGNDTHTTLNGKSTADKTQHIGKETPKINKVDIDDQGLSKSKRIGLARRERNNQIMQNFAKVIWNVLKQTNEKLKAAENEVLILKEDLRKEKTRVLDLEKELNGLKSCCINSSENFADATLNEVTANCEPHEKLDICESSIVEEAVSVTDQGSSECNNNPESCDSTVKHDKDLFPEERSQLVDPDSLCLKDIIDYSHQAEDNTVFADTKKEFGSSDLDAIHFTSDCEENSVQKNHQKGLESDIGAERSVGQDHGSILWNGDNAEDLIESKFVATPCSPNADKTEFAVSSPQYLATVCNDKISPVQLSVKLGDSVTNGIESMKDEPSSDANVSSDPPLVPVNDADSTQECKVALESEARLDPCKSNQKKPKRRLLPAKSVLLREVATLDVEDEIEKSKGNRGGRKVAAEGRKMTQGSRSLRPFLAGKQINASLGFPSGESSVETSSKKPEKLILDLNGVGDAPSANIRLEGRFFLHQNGHRSPSPASSSSSRQPSMRNIDLNDRSYIQNDTSQQGANFWQNVSAYGGAKPDDPVISIMGTRVEVKRTDFVPQTLSLSNGKAPEFAMDANVARTAAFLGMDPTVSYTHPPAFRYSGFTAGPAMSVYTQQPFVTSMTGDKWFRSLVA